MAQGLDGTTRKTVNEGNRKEKPSKERKNLVQSKGAFQWYQK